MSAIKAMLIGTVALAASLITLGDALAIRDIAQDVKSDRVDLDARLLVTTQPQSRNQKLSNLDVSSGGAMDLFYRFGFYSLSIRVVPRDDPGTWLVREPTTKVFDDNSMVISERLGPNTINQQHIQIYLCEDLDELYEAYFRDFTAEGINQPHKMFTGSWRTPIAAKYLGLSPETLVGDSSYLLVKLAKVHGAKGISGNLRLKPEASESIGRIQAGNTDAVLSFVQHFGSHYIKDITVGDVIYQVFALAPEQFHQMRRIIGHGVNTINLSDWANLQELLLAPGQVREAGEIKAASGDTTLQKFLDTELRLPGHFSSYPNLVDGLTRNPNNVNILEELTEQSRAVLGLNLASLRSFVLDPQARQFFDETIDTHSSLFEVNVK